MSPEEFDQQYLSDTKELVVRIAWCWSKKSAAFSKVGDLYHARARFDQALDVLTGEIVGRGHTNWLEWLTPKRRLGHPYGFAFQEGHLYRLLVREARSNADDAVTRSYYVEKILEADVTEPRLDPYQQFAADFHENEVDRWLLMQGGPSGWANVLGYRRTGVRFIAMAKGENDEPVACNGLVRWMERKGALSNKTHFDEMCVYKVRVREGREDPNSLMLVKVVRKLKDARFDALREEYLRPVELVSPLGTFVLNRHYSWFEGTIDYLGNSCSVLLHVPDGSTDGSRALRRLEAVCTDLASLDRKARSYAADELLDCACDWCEEDLTREEFMERMDDVSLSVGEDDSVEFCYQDGGMFAGHVIMVEMDEDDAFVDADIMG